MNFPVAFASTPSELARGLTTQGSSFLETLGYMIATPLGLLQTIDLALTTRSSRELTLTTDGFLCAARTGTINCPGYLNIESFNFSSSNRRELARGPEQRVLLVVLQHVAHFQ